MTAAERGTIDVLIEAAAGVANNSIPSANTTAATTTTTATPTMSQPPTLPPLRVTTTATATVTGTTGILYQPRLPPLQHHPLPPPSSLPFHPPPPPPTQASHIQPQPLHAQPRPTLLPAPVGVSVSVGAPTPTSAPVPAPAVGGMKPEPLSARLHTQIVGGVLNGVSVGLGGVSVGVGGVGVVNVAGGGMVCIPKKACPILPRALCTGQFESPASSSASLAAAAAVAAATAAAVGVGALPNTTATASGATGATAGTGTGVEGDEAASLSEVEKRQLIRKMRNRVSAARSNQKRKVRHTQLKNELEHFRQRERSLRNKHHSLLEENLSLKARAE